MLQIPIQPVPSQQISCVLDNQNCRIGIYLLNDDIFFDLNSNGTDICLATIARNAVPLDARNSYDSFSGNFYFIDVQGLDDPEYTGFGTRWFLVYLTAEEVLLTQQQPAAIVIPAPILTLAATLNVTSPGGGNFSWPHGLSTVPFLIEIIDNNSGAIWAQSGYADATNVNLVAGDIGITAKVLVYTVAAAGLTVTNPATTLLVSSSAPGNFSWPHGLGVVPSAIEILQTSAGEIGAQLVEFDSTNVYLTATAGGLTATVTVFGPVTGALNIQAPAITLTAVAPDDFPFSIPHNLSTAPSRIFILMISDGQIWAQTPAFDGTNVNLVPSSAGRVAKIFVYA